MRLCIADPPYLGRGVMLYGGGRPASFVPKSAGERANITDHPAAHEWDDPSRHARLVRDLSADYDGWAIAGAPDTLHVYLPCVPAGTRICVWNKTNAFPTASRVIPTWEFVLLYIPDERRGRSERGHVLRDVLSVPKINTTVIGAKPPQWTRWVLDMLGYDPETDTVDDIFHGSGAVAAEIAQGVLL